MTDPGSRPPTLPPWLEGAARPVTAAGALVRDPSGRVLLVEPTYKPDWEIPGGIVEAGETPFAACRREVAEELGLDERALPLGRLLCLDWALPSAERPAPALRLVYDGGVLPDLAPVRLQESELASARFSTLEEADALCRPVLARRLRAAVRAAGTGAVLELEDGVPRRT